MCLSLPNRERTRETSGENRKEGRLENEIKEGNDRDRTQDKIREVRVRVSSGPKLANGER